MTPYKGKIKLVCIEKSGCRRKLKTGDVQPSCMDCLAAITQVIDLDGKIIFEYKHELSPIKSKNVLFKRKKKVPERLTSNI